MTASTIDRIQASRRRLSSEQTDVDPGVERLRSLIHGTGASFTLLRVRKRDVRRFDVWIRDGAVVVVPYRDDPEAEVPCGIGALLLLELISDPTTVPVPVGDDGIRRFAEIGDLVQQVTSDDGGPERATVVHSHARDSDLVRISGPGVWWGSARSGEALDLQPAGDASYWAAVFEWLRPAA